MYVLIFPISKLRANFYLEERRKRVGGGATIKYLVLKAYHKSIIIHSLRNDMYRTVIIIF